MATSSPVASTSAVSALGPETRKALDEKKPVKIPNAIAEPTLAKIPKAVHSGPSGKKAINPYATTCGNVASAPTHDAATSTLKYLGLT